MWGGAIKIGVRHFWGRGVFILVISNINIGYQKSLTPPLRCNDVYVNTRQNRQFNIILWVFLHSWDAKEYSLLCEMRLLRVYASVSTLRKPDRTEFSCIVKFIHVCSSLTPSYWHVLMFYEMCSKCLLAYVPPVHMYASNLWTTQQIRSEWISTQIIPPITFSSHFYLLTKMLITFRHSFCHSKRVLVRYSLIFVCEKWWRKLWRKLFINKISTYLNEEWNKLSIFIVWKQFIIWVKL